MCVGGGVGSERGGRQAAGWQAPSNSQAFESDNHIKARRRRRRRYGVHTGPGVRGEEAGLGTDTCTQRIENWMAVEMGRTHHHHHGADGSHGGQGGQQSSAWRGVAQQQHEG